MFLSKLSGFLNANHSCIYDVSSNNTTVTKRLALLTFLNPLRLLAWWNTEKTKANANGIISDFQLALTSESE